MLLTLARVALDHLDAFEQHPLLLDIDAENFPALAEFLTATRWDNGDVRAPGTLTVFTDGPVWKVCLSDKDAGVVAFVTAESPDGVLLAANKGLETGSLDWRSQKDRPRGNRR